MAPEEDLFGKGFVGIIAVAALVPVLSVVWQAGVLPSFAYERIEPGSGLPRFQEALPRRDPQLVFACTEPAI